MKHSKPMPRGKLRKVLPVFFDPSGKRKIFVAAFGVGLLIAALSWTLGFGVSLYYLTKVSGFDSAGQIANVSPPLRETIPFHLPEPEPGLAVDGDASPVSSAGRPAEPCGEGRGVRPATGGGTQARGAPQIYAYLPSWPPWSLVSLERNCSKFDVLMPEWFEAIFDHGQLRALEAGEPHQIAIGEHVARNRSAISLMPVVNADGFGRPEQALAAFGSARWRREIAASIADEAAEHGYDGMCVHVAGVPEAGHRGIADLFAEIKRGFGGTERKTCLVTSLAGSLWRFEPLKQVVDRMVVLGFDEPGRAQLPGPLAPQAWFAGRMSEVFETLDPAKTVVALGSFGYDWISGVPEPRRIAYLEVMRRAGFYGSDIRLDPQALNATTSFVDAGGQRHHIWLLDAISAYNQLRVLAGNEPGGVAIWAMGEEDPQVWDILGEGGRMPPADAEALLSTVRIDDYVGFEGEGPFETTAQQAEPGERRLQIDPATGIIKGQTFSRRPQAYTLARFGEGRRNLVALTFDDGPDPTYTSDILDILKENDVPAAFFVVGRNALRHAQSVKRIVDEGHEIGVHTFLHPNIADISDLRLRYELNTTQRLISVLTGYRTTLFRLPYGRSGRPLTATQARQIKLLNDYGYVIVATQISPTDWRDLEGDALVAQVHDDIRSGRGNVIVLHDAGGDRRETVKALPGLIGSLRAQGYTLVPLAALFEKERADVMPPQIGSRVLFDTISFEILAFLGAVLRWTFWTTIALGVARVAIIAVLAHMRRHRSSDAGDFTPPVTVIIPAFCEESVICDSVAAALASDYPDVKVIVVDDGSTDATNAVLQRAFGDDPRVRIIRQPNKGKFAALNRAYGHVDTDIVIAIDADTTIRPDAIRRLVGHFKDPRVGAVAGNVKVGNRRNLMTRLQALEYITAQNLDRRAFEWLNGILVVPGAIGAWRRRAVAQAGYYTPATLAEDADLTVSVIRAGYKVLFEERALGTTEVPETVGQFLRQRLRWIFGMMQTGWKHRGAFAERRAIGLVSIPDILVFGVFMPLFAPVADLVFLAAVTDYLFDWAFNIDPALSRPSANVILGYALFVCADLLLVMMAFRFEPSESKWLVALIPFQRFFYRQLLYFSAARAVANALAGRFTKWRKVTRIAATAHEGKEMARAARRTVQLQADRDDVLPARGDARESVA